MRRLFAFLILTFASGTAFGDSLRFAWDPPPNYWIAGYHVYRSDTSGGPYKRLTTEPVSCCEYSDGTAAAGRQYFYVVTTAGFEGNESAFSSELAVSLADYTTVPEPGAMLFRVGTDLRVQGGDLVLLAGNRRDPARKIVSYLWSQASGTAVWLSGIDRAEAGFLAPLVQADTVLVFALTATDANGGVTIDYIRVTIRPR